MPSLNRCMSAVATAAITLLVAAASASADTVTTTADHDDGSCSTQDCTLREAIRLSPANEPVFLPAGTYRLTQGELVSGRDLIVVGAGARTTTITAAGAGRVLRASAGNLTFSSVTLTGGSVTGDGGAVLIEAAATATFGNVALRGNTATGSGGAVSNAGTLAITSATVSGNRAGADGGGIASAGALSLVSTTVDGNTAAGSGGGIALGEGGSIVASTISANTAAAGGALSLAASGNAQLATSILAGNAPANCATAGTLSSTGRVLSTDGSCALGGPGDLQGVDPLLAPLADNGGPTDTRALAAASPAVDAGDPVFCLGVDQRGAPRPFGASCDIGAFEFGATPPVLPTLPAPVAGFTVNALPNQGVVRVRLPGTSTYILLTQGLQVPVGTTFDTTQGRVTLVAAANAAAVPTTQKAWFYEGVFKVTQTRGLRPVTTLAMNGPVPTGCGGRAAAVVKKVKSRRLWGDGKGRFSTKGQFSSATVRGTKWLVTDTCAGTRTRVVRGSVTVRDLRRGRTVVVRAGQSYLVKR